MVQSTHPVAECRHSLGRRERATSYSDADCTTPVNEVVFEYSGLGALVAERQEHAGAVGGGTPAVGYAYDTATGTYNGLSGVLTGGLRLTGTTYPNGRKLFYRYGTAGSLSDRLSRLAAIHDDDGSGALGAALSAYSFSGVGAMVVEDFPQPQVRLDRFGSSGDTINPVRHSDCTT